MSYTLPEFNLVANIHDGSLWPAPESLRLSASCNVAYGRRVVVVESSFPEGGLLVLACLLFPAGTDVRAAQGGAAADIVEVPPGSGRVYQVNGVFDFGQGFANEHRVAVSLPFGDWPVPLPPVFVP
jgi:hypothetical protein